MFGKFPSKLKKMILEKDLSRSPDLNDKHGLRRKLRESEITQFSYRIQLTIVMIEDTRD